MSQQSELDFIENELRKYGQINQDPKELLNALQDPDSIGESQNLQLQDLLGRIKGEQQQKSITVVPTPGFVIKTADKEGQKYFINVLHTSKVPPPGPWKDGKKPENLEKVLSDLQFSQKQIEEEVLRFPMSVTSPLQDTDKKGELCVTVDAALSTNVMEAAQESRQLKHYMINMVMEYIGNKLKVELDKHYKLPKMRYKGSQIQEQHIRNEQQQPIIDEIKQPVNEDPADTEFPLQFKRTKQQQLQLQQKLKLEQEQEALQKAQKQEQEKALETKSLKNLDINHKEGQQQSLQQNAHSKRSVNGQAQGASQGIQSGLNFQEQELSKQQIEQAKPVTTPELSSDKKLNDKLDQQNNISTHTKKQQLDRKMPIQQQEENKIEEAFRGITPKKTQQLSQYPIDYEIEHIEKPLREFKITIKVKQKDTAEQNISLKEVKVSVSYKSIDIRDAQGLNILLQINLPLFVDITQSKAVYNEKNYITLNLPYKPVLMVLQDLKNLKPHVKGSLKLNSELYMDEF